MPCGDAPASLPREPHADDTTRERRRFAGNAHVELLTFHERVETRAREAVEEGVLVPEPHGSLAQRLAEARVELLLEEGDEKPAHSITRMREVGVAPIDGEREVPVGEEAANVGTCRTEQRPEEPAPYPCHSGEPAAPRAPQQVEQDRLRLVVEGMAGDDPLGSGAGRHLPERPVAHPACARLEIPPAGDGAPASLARNAEPRTQRRDRVSLHRALRTERVVDVRRGENQPVRGPQLGERREERRRVRPSRDGDEKSRAPLRRAGCIQRRREHAEQPRRWRAYCVTPGRTRVISVSAARANASASG